LSNNALSGEIPASIVHLTRLGDLTLSCGLTSSDPAVIAFIDALAPGWQNHLCLSLSSIAAQDGWVLESSEKSNAGGALDTNDAGFNLGDEEAREQFRGILSFSTGSLPDNAVVTKVTLKVKKNVILGGGDPLGTFQGLMVDIKKGFFGTTSALQAADFQAVASKTCGPFTPVPAGNWYTIDLTAGRAYINKLATNSGLTQIRLRFRLDDNNDAVANILSLYSGNAPVANRPQLVITYSVP